MAYQKLELSEFLFLIERQVNTDRPKPFTWLIGAGFSASSGIPLAKEVSHILTLYEYIGRNKMKEYEDELIGFGYNHKELQYYLDWYYELKANHPDRYEKLITDAYEWLKSRDKFHTVTRDSPECYQALFTHLVKIQDDHHHFLTNLIQRVKGVNVAHIGLAGLLIEHPKWGHTVFTTNFDDLLLKGILSLNHTARIFGEIESNDNVAIDPSYPQIVYLHGRHTGYRLLNTQEQISSWYQPKLKESFGNHIQTSHLIIIGYSGWDDMVMKTLANWNQQNKDLVSGSLFWIPYRDEDTLEPHVKDFLNQCPHDKTFVIVNNEKNLNADSFILALCDSVNKRNGGFASYRRNVLATAETEHRFILKQLEEYPDFDPQKALEIIESADQAFREGQIDKSNYLLNEAFQIISQPDIPTELRAKAEKQIGTLYYKLANLTKAEEILLNSLRLFNQIFDKTPDILLELAENQRLLTEVYINKNNLAEAYNHVRNAIFNSSTIIKTQSNEKALMNLTLSEFCRMYIQLLQGNLNPVDLDIKSIKEKEDLIASNAKLIGKFYQICANYFLLRDKTSMASENLAKSTSYFSKIEDEKNILLNQVYYSYICLKERNPEVAFSTISKTLDRFIELKDRVGIAMCNNTIGYFKSLSSTPEEAEIYYEEAIKDFDLSKSEYNLINALTDLLIFQKKQEKSEAANTLKRLEELSHIENQYYRRSRNEK